MTDAQRLAAAFTGDGPIDHLDNRPQDVAAGYALQDGVRAALGRPVIGWKLAQTVPAAQKAAGIEAPTVSPLLEGMIVHADTEFPSRQFYKPEAEAEIAIELKDAIDRPVGAEDVRAAAAGFRLAIEIADTRFVDKPGMGVPAVIGDMNSCGALVIGSLRDVTDLDAAATAAVITRLGDGTEVAAFPLEMRPNPLEVVAFLSRFVTERGETLTAGTIITTGTHTPPTRTGPGPVTAAFDGAGTIACRLS